MACGHGGVVRGNIYLIGGQYVVARETAAAGALFLGAVSGAVEATKLAGAGNAIAVGGTVYYDIGNASVTGDNSSGVKVGVGLEAKADGDVVALVLLTNPV